MAKASLGRLEPVAVREVWPNEESDFTPWLAEPENLGVLADALGMSLEFVAREEKVGPYSADILCRDPNDQTKVVVENQLGQTDHDHLGKLLTYAAHFNARVLVWVARTFTDQHRAALDWLNEVSETGTRFFGLEIELWKIGDSVPAPKFNVVARPNDWTRDGVDAAALTDTQRMQLAFWEGFTEFVSRKGTIVKKRNLPTTLRHVTSQCSEPSFPSLSWPSAACLLPSTALTGSGRLIQTSAESTAARGGPATKRSGRAA